jgi:hypothetical protein
MIMALPTAPHPAATPPMRPTPGVGAAPATAGTMQPMAGHVAQTPDTKGAEPTMPEGMDKVLLHRLYPDADSTADLEAKAMAQGKQTHELGAKLKAAQQEPVVPET